MSDQERLDAAVREVLDLPDDARLDDLAYGRTERWDSVGHLQLVLGIETAFGIAIEGDDVFELSDYAAVRRILRDRYGLGLDRP